MAKASSVNVDCATNGGAEAIWNLVSLLVSNGWTLAFSSDNTGAAVTNSGTGAGGLNRINAYVVVQDPSGSSGRKFLFQRSSTAANNYAWWVRYARSAALSGATATVMPTSSDIQNLFGTSAAGTTLFSTTTNYFAHAVCETTAAFGVYQFWFAATVKVTGVPSGGGYSVGMDTVAPSAGLNQDPSVMRVAASRSFAEFNGNYAFTSYPTLASFSTSISRLSFSATSTPNAYTGKDDSLPMMWVVNQSAPYLGQSTWLRSALALRSYPDTTNLTTDAYVYFSNNSSPTNYALFPWPESVTPQL